jgi:uncharacterized membrane protein
MEDNVVVVTFTETSKAYQALSELDRLGSAGDIQVRSAVLLTRTDEGFSIPEGADNASGFYMAGGGLIGALVGVLGGPVGVLLGGSIGLLAGAPAEVARLDDQDIALSGITKDIAPGDTALVAEVTEYTQEVLDKSMGALGGTVSRRWAGDVYADIEAVKDAQFNADVDAFKARIRDRRADRKADWERFKAKAAARV